MNPRLCPCLLLFAILALAGCAVESPPPNRPAETNLEPLSEHTGSLPEADYDPISVAESGAPSEEVTGEESPATPRRNRDLDTWPNLCRVADYLERVDGHIVAHITIVNRRPVPIDTLIYVGVSDGRRGTETEKVLFKGTPMVSERLIQYTIEPIDSLPSSGYITIRCKFGYIEYEDEGNPEYNWDVSELEFHSTARSSNELSTSARPYTLRSRW